MSVSAWLAQFGVCSYVDAVPIWWLEACSFLHTWYGIFSMPACGSQLGALFLFHLDFVPSEPRQTPCIWALVNAQFRLKPSDPNPLLDYSTLDSNPEGPYIPAEVRKLPKTHENSCWSKYVAQICENLMRRAALRRFLPCGPCYSIGTLYRISALLSLCPNLNLNCSRGVSEHHEPLDTTNTTPPHPKKKKKDKEIHLAETMVEETTQISGLFK